MTKESIWIKIGVPVIVAILILIIGNIVNDYMNPPEAIPVLQYNEKLCPTTLRFSSAGDETSSFSLKFQNTGDDGVLYVTIHSDKLLSRASDEKVFQSNSTKQLFMNSKQVNDFNFELKKSEDIKVFENFSIRFNYGSYEEILGYPCFAEQHTWCCNYRQDGPGGYNYRLVNQTCF